LEIWIAVLVWFWPALSFATEPLRTAVETESRTIREAAESQAVVDRAYDETRALAEEYSATVRELESLRRYDDQLEKMISSQRETIDSLQRQLEGIDFTHREIGPMMSRMAESLSRFVELDAPFRLEERRLRVSQLRELIDAPDISLAEKYRRIMEAFQIEVDYGRTVEAYRDKVLLRGQEQSSDFLRFGRLVLIYQTLDGMEAGFWDQTQRAWVALPEHYRTSVEKGFRIARKQAAPDLLPLPVPAPNLPR
jgi:hypothetical protein